jgi:hypothetical protein
MGDCSILVSTGTDEQAATAQSRSPSAIGLSFKRATFVHMLSTARGATTVLYQAEM